MELAGISFGATVVSTIVIALAIILTAIFSDMRKEDSDPKQVLVQPFLALLTLLSVLVVSGVLVSYGIIAFKYGVFKDADVRTVTPTTPPVMYTDKGVETLAQCTTETSCPWTESQKAQVQTWVDNYRDWRVQNDSRLRSDLVNTSSVAIVAIPLLVILWLLLRRSLAAVRVHSAGYHTAVYGATFLGVGLFIFSGIMLSNAVLRQTLLPNTTDVTQYYYYAYPEKGLEETSVDVIASCSACDPDAAAVAREWKQQNAELRDRYKNANQYAERYAEGIPLLIVSSLVASGSIYLIRKDRLVAGERNRNSV